MFLIIDRIEEGKIAVCETQDGSFVRIGVNQLPEGCREGTVLKKEENGYRIDRAEAERRRQEILKLQNALFDEE